MAATNFSQSGAELRIQDGGAHESRPCWKTAHQPRRRTGIGLTDFHGDTNHARVMQKKCQATSNSILTVSCGLKRHRSVRQAAMMKTERLGSESNLYRGGAKHHGTMTSPVSNQSKEIRMNLKQWLLQSPSLKESTKPNITHCQMSRTLIANLLR